MWACRTTVQVNYSTAPVAMIGISDRKSVPVLNCIFCESRVRVVQYRVRYTIVVVGSVVSVLDKVSNHGRLHTVSFLAVYGRGQLFKSMENQ